MVAPALVHVPCSAANVVPWAQALALADVNNDGRPDLLVGQPYYSGKLLGAGRVAVYLGVSTYFNYCGYTASVPDIAHPS